MPRGRPTKYKPEYCDDIVEFFQSRLEAYENSETEPEDDYVPRGPRSLPIFFPTFARYAVKLGVCEDTLCEWAKVHPEFSEAKKQAKAIQDAILVQCGIKGTFVPSVTIFTMKNTMKWTDRSDVSVGGEIKTHIPTGRLTATEKQQLEALMDKAHGASVDE